MAERVKPDKGKYLELRIARLMYAQGLSPFVNVFFRGYLEPQSMTHPDIDVMGFRLLPDATTFFVHYDCKSGDSDVISRILMLVGLKNRIPAGPIMYVRKKASLEIKRYALQYGIKISSIWDLEEREKKFVTPRFGDVFPAISDTHIHELWQRIKYTNKDKQIGRIMKYFDFEFWAEETFSRVRRSIAAVELLRVGCSEVGLQGHERDVITALFIRRFLFALLTAASHVAFFGKDELKQAVGEWLITEKLPVIEYQTIVESAAQLAFDLYGDPNKGPLRKEDYFIPPPEYSEELVSLIDRTVRLYDILPIALPAFDALVLEDAIMQRTRLVQALLAGATRDSQRAIGAWLRSVMVFLSAREPSLGGWRGWGAVAAGSNGGKEN